MAETSSGGDKFDSKDQRRGARELDGGSDKNEHKRAKKSSGAEGEARKADDVGLSNQSSEPRLELSDHELALKHKIFLSHSGAQKKFTEHLWKALMNVHHYSFFDRCPESLRKGESFLPPLLKAAKECCLAVLVLSKEYFTVSKWPMIELNEFAKRTQKANTVLKIVPLFYHIEWEEFKKKEVRQGWFEEWEKMEKEEQEEMKSRLKKKDLQSPSKEDPESISKEGEFESCLRNEVKIDLREWKDALSVLEGINVIECVGKKQLETEVIQDVVKHICQLLPPDVKYDVSHVQAKDSLCKPILESFKNIKKSGEDKPRVLGLHGMGGVGKTTISRAICNHMAQDFVGKVCQVDLGSMNTVDLHKTVLRELTEASPAILVNEHDKLADLLHQRMRRQKVFLVLDNVWDHHIVTAQMYLRAVFDKDSMVLVTSRSRDVLHKQLEIQDCIEMPSLKEEDATDIFLHYANISEKFKSDEKDKLRDEEVIVKTCVNLCRFLKGEREDPSKGVESAYHYLPLALKVLGSQLGSMSPEVKDWRKNVENFEARRFNLLLDNVNPVFSILRPAYDTLRMVERDIFLDLALVWVSNGRRPREFRVRFEWEWLCIIHRKNMAEMQESVKVLQRKGLLDRINDVDPLDYNIHDLYVYFAEAEVQEGPFKKRRFVFDKEGTAHELQKYPSGSCWPSLERLIIHKCQVQSLKRAKLHLCKNVEVLDLDCCELIQEVDVTGMENLRCIVLSGCKKLRQLKGIEALSDLVILCWADSVELIEPEFLSSLSSLMTLEALKLETLTWSVKMEFPLDLSKCTNLREFSLSNSTFPFLVKESRLSLLDCGLILPASVTKINFSGCPLGSSPMSSMRAMKNMQDLSLCNCKEVEDLRSLGELNSLRKLDVDGTGIIELPDDLRKLKHLEVLDVSGCLKLTNLVCIVHATALQRVDASRCENLRELPNDISALTKLEFLDLSYCKNLTNIVCIAQAINLRHVNASHCEKLFELPDNISRLNHLRLLDLSYCDQLTREVCMAYATPLLHVIANGCLSTVWEGSKPNHEIFLSFSEAQKNFTRQLCNDLERVVRYPFFDSRSDSLVKGENLPSPLQVIRQCRVVVLVLTDEFFTHSKWPMMELNESVTSQGSNNPGPKILPLFLGITREQFVDKERQADWFKKWEEFAHDDPRINVEAWKAALSKILGLNAMEYTGGAGGEVAFRTKVVEVICQLLPPPDVKFDVSHVQSLQQLCEPIKKKLKEVEVSSKFKVKVIGLYGMGGVGKTTISKAICNLMFEDFNGKVCHVELGSNDPVELKKRVLRGLTDASAMIMGCDSMQLDYLLKKRMDRQKVFFVLDNVWDGHVEEARRYLNIGYHAGSLILVISRSIGVLKRLQIEESNCMEMPKLEEEGAMNMFLYYATISSESIKKHSEWEIVKRCVKECSFSRATGKKATASLDKELTYHPLSLKVLGSQLSCFEIKDWDEALKQSNLDKFNMFEEVVNPIFSILRSGFDSLHNEHQDVFLDLALIWVPKSEIGGSRLRFEWKWLCIIYAMSEAEMKASMSVLHRSALIDNVSDVDSLDYQIHPLYVEFAKAEANSGPFETRRFLIDNEGTDEIPYELQMRPTGFCWPRLARIIIHESQVESLQSPDLRYCANVTVFDLDCCNKLKEIDVRGMEYLKCLVATDCVQLGHWTGLHRLSNLVIFHWAGSRKPFGPEFVHELLSLAALQILKLESLNWSMIEMFPPDLSRCINLRELSITHPNHPNGRSQETPAPVDFGSSLPNSVMKIDFSDCPKPLGMSPISSMMALTNLQDLNLRNCDEIKDLVGLGELTSLRQLDVGGTGISELPDDLWKLKHLEVLNVRDCSKLTNLVCIVHATTLVRVDASHCDNLRKLPDDFSTLTKLEFLDLSHCKNLNKIVCSYWALELKHVHVKIWG